MDALDGLLEQLKDALAEIADVEESLPDPADPGALAARLDHLHARREALQEEIDQLTGASR